MTSQMTNSLEQDYTLVVRVQMEDNPTRGYMYPERDKISAYAECYPSNSPEQLKKMDPLRSYHDWQKENGDDGMVMRASIRVELQRRMYVAYALPREIANRCVDEVNRGDYSSVDTCEISLFRNQVIPRISGVLGELFESAPHYNRCEES